MIEQICLLVVMKITFRSWILMVMVNPDEWRWSLVVLHQEIPVVTQFETSQGHLSKTFLCLMLSVEVVSKLRNWENYSFTFRCLMNAWRRWLIFRFFPTPPPHPPPIPLELIRKPPSPRLFIFKEWWSTNFFSAGKWVFLFM